MIAVAIKTMKLSHSSLSKERKNYRATNVVLTGLKVCAKVRQRYLLVVMCMLGHSLSVMDRQAFATTIDDIVYKRLVKEDERLKPECQENAPAATKYKEIEEFRWSGWLQLCIMSAMTVGMHLGMLPMGMATDRFGAKTLFGLSVFVPGVCCLLTPICIRTSPYLVLVIRFITGAFEAAQYPAVGWLAVRWFPIRQQGVMLAIVFLGLPLGNSVGHMIAKRFSNSWTSNYYVLAGISVLWGYIWQATVWEDPFEHPYITLEELEMLIDKVPMYATDTELEPGWKWPWKAILTSKSLAILIVGQLGYTLFSSYTLFIIPRIYFPETHNYSITDHGGLIFFLDVMLAFAILASGSVSDKLIHARWLNTTHVIKTFYSISTVTGSLLLLGLVHSDCSTTSAILFYVATVLCLGFSQTNWSHACLHLAPNFVGICMAISSILSVTVLPLQLYIEYTFTVHGRLNEWKTVTYMNAAASILMAAIFLKWGNCQLRPWNRPQKNKPGFEVDYEKQEPREDVTTPSSKDRLPGEKSAEVSTSRVRLAQSAARITTSRSQIGGRRLNDDEFGVIELTPSMHLDKVKTKRVSTENEWWRSA